MMKKINDCTLKKINGGKCTTKNFLIDVGTGAVIGGFFGSGPGAIAGGVTGAAACLTGF